MWNIYWWQFHKRILPSHLGSCIRHFAGIFRGSCRRLHGRIQESHSDLPWHFQDTCSEAAVSRPANNVRPNHTNLHHRLFHRNPGHFSILEKFSEVLAIVLKKIKERINLPKMLVSLRTILDPETESCRMHPLNGTGKPEMELYGRCDRSGSPPRKIFVSRRMKIPLESEEALVALPSTQRLSLFPL